MKPAPLLFTALLLTSLTCFADPKPKPLIDADFSTGDFKALDWKVDGSWDIFNYTNAPAGTNPGWVARCQANQPDGTLSKTFHEIKNPAKLELSMDVGFGWGSATMGDGIGFMLLDPKGNGYVFSVHRAKATWAMQWAPVANRVAPGQTKWAKDEIDGTHPSILDGGGMIHLTITRGDAGTWTFTAKDFNKGAGATVAFDDKTTTSFSELVLLGPKNINELAFNHILLQLSK